jgi:dihydrofolate reductase
MRKIVYYVATSLDGFISGSNEDISGFVPGGNGIDQYLLDLQSFDTVIMGKNTYQFGYKFGLQPGQAPYPHMANYIFSNSIVLNNASPNVFVKPLQLKEIENIQQKPGTDIYLCGGGQLAGWLLDNRKIDILKIKLNPLVLGTGVRLFGDSTRKFQTELLESNSYENGLQIITYKLLY